MPGVSVRLSSYPLYLVMKWERNLRINPSSPGEFAGDMSSRSGGTKISPFFFTPTRAHDNTHQALTATAAQQQELNAHGDLGETELYHAWYQARISVVRLDENIQIQVPSN